MTKVQEMASHEGDFSTCIPHLSLFRRDSPSPTPMPVIYQPSIYMVLLGSKAAFLGKERYQYDPMHYLVSCVPLPLEGQILQASPEIPYLAVRISLDTQMINELLIEMPLEPWAARTSFDVKQDEHTTTRGIYVSAINPDIQNTLSRLLDCAKCKIKAQVLGQLALKELIYHVLNDKYGALLRAFACQDRQQYQIANVLQFINRHYASNMDIPTLASKANMSESSFYQHFKAATNTSPIQYIKTVRLHAAKRKMVFEHYNATTAAYEVGYTSTSQFSREYRRRF
jgi:AraC-like DNA-binding protein